MSGEPTDFDLDGLLAWLAEGHVRYLRLRVGTTEVAYSSQASAATAEPAPAAPATAPEPAPDRLRAAASNGHEALVAAPPTALTAAAAGEPAREPAGAAPDGRLGVDVVAPMVGIFHHAPAPGAPPYVVPGQQVMATTTVGLVESMKVFTAVAAGTAGTVETVLVANGRPVDKGQPLVRLRPGPAAGDRAADGAGDRAAEGGIG